ncbi:MAG: hypothetical protein LBU32_30265 [Clostridiales bacterium]|jgi:hypothetical protein|nr:hypothetical protein [Clostridiales bacterium]
MEQQNRVILISGDNSKWYDQAIFIVKKNIPESKIPVDFVMEAEKVINAYMAKKRRDTDSSLRILPPAEMGAVKGEAKKRSWGMKFNIMLNIVLFAGCLTLLAILYMGR